MKKLIAGFALAFLASPAAQAWTGGIEDMRTMEANQSGPILRIKGTNIASNGCCNVRCAPRQVVKHRPKRSPARHSQVVYHRAAPVRPVSVCQHTHGVVSEKMYTQRVYRRPANTCPLR